MWENAVYCMMDLVKYYIWWLGRSVGLDLRGGSMITRIQKRNGDIVDFDILKIEKAIFAAAQSVGGQDRDQAQTLAHMVRDIVVEVYGFGIPTVEDIQDVVEKVLIEEGHAATAKSYIIYRQKHNELRDAKNLFLDAESMVDDYISLSDWKVNENSNMGFSLQGLNNHIVDSITKKYWLSKIYDKDLREAHVNGDLHIHDLGLLAPYCCGWDLEGLLMQGFQGAAGKVQSAPASHFSSFLGQIVNWLYTLQGEAAGAQAVSSLDTYAAPFIAKDQLSFEEVKKIVRSFVFNLNIPTRVGFQTPFTNITLDIAVHPLLKNDKVIIGGKRGETTYGDYQKEMDLFNKAYCQVMMEGDGAGRSFSFPIPTINITDDFPWDSEVAGEVMEMTRKFGTPYFANFVNSDMKPEDIRSMCCRLRLDNRELRKRGGGLFGANPLTGSINVVTLNMGRLGYLASSVEDFKARVRGLMEKSKRICEAKRVMLEKYMEGGLYPYSRFYLQGVKDTQGAYFKNHFNTIGLNGMNEACLNLLGEDITTEDGQEFAVEIMDFMNKVISIYQEETGSLWNLEASPAEGAAYRFARVDKRMYPKIMTAGQDEPYYTNSTQLPVGHTKDVFEALELQEPLQTRYTGGTVLHAFMGEEIESKEAVKSLLKKAFANSEIPYLTITPTYSICPDHGYLKGEQASCPDCGKETEIWTRVVGFHRPVKSWNKGKKEEYKDRLTFDTKVSLASKRSPEKDKTAAS